MATDDDFAELNQAYAITKIRAGDLREALDKYLEIAGDAEAQHEDKYAAMFLPGIGDIYEGLGDFEKALKYQEYNFKKIRQRLEKNPEDEDNIVAMSSACMGLGSIYSKLSKIEKAYALFGYMYNLSTEFLKLNPVGLVELKMKAFACGYLCDLYLRQELYSSAFDFCTEYNSCLLEIAAIVPDDIDIKNKINWSNIYLGDYHERTEHAMAAWYYYSKAEEGAANLVNDHKNNADFDATNALANERLGDIYFARGDDEQALKYYMKNHEILVILTKAYPEHLTFQQNLMVSFQHLAIVCHRQKKLDQALTYLDECYDLTIKLIGKVAGYADLKAMLPVIFQYRAFIYTDLGKLEDATANYIAMYNYISDLTKQYPANPLFKDKFAYTCYIFGLFLRQQGNNKNALKYLEEGNQLYGELVAEFPSITEYKEKADSLAETLGSFKI